MTDARQRALDMLDEERHAADARTAWEEEVSNVGAWDDHHAHLTAPHPYGVSSYQNIADWLYPCATVEDWGCGGGGLRAYINDGPHRYFGVDGSASPYADVRADLTRYHSHAEGIALRHVLEHNDRWQAVLANAVESFTKRLIIVLFTPLVQQTRIMFREPDYGNVPVLAFRLGDLLAEFPDEMTVAVVPDHPSPDTAFGVETFITAER